ncbi:hypothetical protein AB835_00415 [Candidatus Endobugula sertula]|uniref:DUF599 domain-containing protein n=1 Tax=Candidatus Endobugula sertula TaxID=62101 RepID=A0A1D2QTX5_9GAMM|nr:hypothetical protein AB835_00415 [Candidatus Endobugula sertula]
MLKDSIVNIIAVVWFLLVWIGYAYFAKYKSKCGCTLSSVMNRQRLDWMKRMLERDTRVTDSVLVANLERNCSFLASTSIFVLAGLLTTLGIVNDLEATLKALPFYIIADEHDSWIHLKILLLILIYVYAFFTLSWSMRQYVFGSLMIGSAPEPDDANRNPFLKQQHAYVSSKVIDMAGHTYNYGLRAYSFSLAALSWFFSPWYFIVASTLVAFVLYLREFHSRPYKVLRDYQAHCDAEVEKHEAHNKS